jgi:hypothetical protein
MFDEKKKFENLVRLSFQAQTKETTATGYPWSRIKHNMDETHTRPTAKISDPQAKC